MRCEGNNAHEFSTIGLGRGRALVRTRHVRGREGGGGGKEGRDGRIEQEGELDQLSLLLARSSTERHDTAVFCLLLFYSIRCSG